MGWGRGGEGNFPQQLKRGFLLSCCDAANANNDDDDKDDDIDNIAAEEETLKQKIHLEKKICF